jgi:Tol biopolymer transport system component
MVGIFRRKWLGRSARRRSTPYRPRIEALEDRCVPSTVTQLTNTFIASTTVGWLSADGSKVAYLANVNPTGQNAAHHSEVFLYNAATGSTTQLTGGASNTLTLTGGGTRLAFISDGDLVPGKNPSHDLQLFLYDTATGTFTQVTSTGSLLSSAYFFINPVLNADGTWLAFESNADLVRGKNSKHERELFLYSIAGGTFTQVTTGNNYISGSAVLSAHATSLAFRSSDDLVPGKNPHRYDELFLYNLPSGGLTQITPGSTDTSDPRPLLSADGTRVAFESNGNVNGQNIPLMFLYNASTGETIQVTPDGGYYAALSPDGTQVAFVASSNLDHGQNPNGYAELFLYDTAQAFTQITPGTRPYSGATPVFSADGTTLAFVSDADLDGFNGSHDPQVFLYHVRKGTTTQATRNSDSFDFGPLYLSAHGSVLAFQSTDNLSGQNPAHANQVFLTDATLRTSLQLTQGGLADNSQPFISADGRLVAFQSDANLNGRNPNGSPEVFLYNTVKGTLTGTQADYASLLTESPDGTVVAFESDGDVVRGRNPNHSEELFLYNFGTGALTQVTPGTTIYGAVPVPSQSGDPQGPSLSAGGAEVAYSTSWGLFLYNAATGITTPVAQDASDYALSGNGKILAFVASADLVPGKNPGHNSELFLDNIATGTLTQATSGVNLFAGPPALSVDGTKLAINFGNAIFNLSFYNAATGRFTEIAPTLANPFLSAPALRPDGTELAFVSSSDLVPGKNPQFQPQVFLYNTVTRVFTQLTTGNGTSIASDPVFSPDGAALAFLSSGDLVPGQNPNQFPQVFLDNLAGGPLAQLTQGNSPGVSIGALSLSNGGQAVAFASNADLTGQNPDGNTEIFLASGPGLTGGPAFSNLTPSQAILYGTAAVTLSGMLSGVPAGAKVSISAGSASTTATVGGNGRFSAMLNTAALAASAAPYRITYSYTGNSSSASNTTTALTIDKAAPSFSALTPSPTITVGTASLTLSGKLTAGTAVPAGETVTITIDGLSATPTVAADGTFSATLNTSGLVFSPTAEPITYSYAGDGNFIAAVNTATTLRVARGTPSFSLLTSRTITYGTATVTLTGKLSAGVALPAGDPVTVSIGGASATATVQIDGTFSATLDTSALHASAIAYPITYSFTGDRNFGPIKDRSTGLTVVKAVPSFSDLTPSQSMIYGSPSVTLSGLLPGVAAGSTVTISVGGVSVKARVGSGGNFRAALATGAMAASPTPYTITYSYAGSGDFTAASDSSTTLTVNKVVASFSHLTPSQTIPYGTAAVTLSGALPAGTAGGTVTITAGSASATVKIDQNGRFSVKLNTSTLAVSSTAYPITYSYPGSENIDAADSTSTHLTVHKANQTIVFGPLSNRFPGDVFALNATASSGLPVTFTVSGPAALAGNVLTVTGPGLVAVQAAQVGNDNYNAAVLSRRFHVATSISGSIGVQASLPKRQAGSAPLYVQFLTITNDGARTLTDNLQLVLANMPARDAVMSATFGSKGLVLSGTSAGYPVLTIPRSVYGSLAPGKSFRIELVLSVTVALSYQVETFQDVGF